MKTKIKVKVEIEAEVDVDVSIAQSNNKLIANPERVNNVNVDLEIKDIEEKIKNKLNSEFKEKTYR